MAAIYTPCRRYLANGSTIDYFFTDLVNSAHSGEPPAFPNPSRHRLRSFMLQNQKKCFQGPDCCRIQWC
ncbi:hypothetical protein LXL04_008007 [Taraxacum kok-saghyz]